MTAMIIIASVCGLVTGWIVGTVMAVKVQADALKEVLHDHAESGMPLETEKSKFYVREAEK